MAEIFLSYSHEDKTKVEPLARALEAQGWIVFWDKRIPAGKSWSDVLEEQLSGAKCVIVVWSARSVRSDWVREEAENARNRRVLIPILIEDVMPPMGFQRIQKCLLI